MDLDDVDAAYVRSLVPEGAIPTGLLSVVTWLHAETGEAQWRVWCDIDMPISSALGHLELAKADLMARTFGGLPDTGGFSRDEGD